ncbi:WAP, Kazal, immunoglobulin, Kunitz and NTR domain-containing protein 2, partial [Armadillidium vulgare]
GCDKPIIPGLCLEFTERCAYNKWTRQCQKFWFGGCGGNGNNYETLEECEEEYIKIIKERFPSELFNEVFFKFIEEIEVIQALNYRLKS